MAENGGLIGVAMGSSVGVFPKSLRTKKGSGVAISPLESILHVGGGVLDGKNVLPQCLL